MTLIHVVFFKFKSHIWEDEFAKAELISKFEGFNESEIVKETAEEFRVSCPVWGDRTKGYEWALYSRFKNRELYEKYRDDPTHNAFIKSVIQPCLTEPPMAYDWEF